MFSAAAGVPEGSVFYGRELPQAKRVLTAWGQHSLVDAAKALLAAALVNPRNQRFFLISESTLPLYSPLLWYSQVGGEYYNPHCSFDRIEGDPRPCAWMIPGFLTNCTCS